MITIASNSGTEQDIADAMVANGIKPEETAAPVVEAKPAEDKSKSVSAEAPGDKIPAETEDKSAAVTEPVKDKSQEKPPEEQVVAAEIPPEPKKEKAKGGFQIKVDKLTKTVDLLQSQLDAKEGNEARLRRELEEAQAELVKLKPPEPETSKELVRPKRPKLSEFEFDQDKYDAALEAYEGKLDEYHAAVTNKTVSDALKAENDTRSQKEQEERIARAEAEFHERRKKGESLYPDFADLRDALPEDAETLINRSPVVRRYIGMKSKEPVHLVRFLMKDFLENDEVEANRFMEMDDDDQLIAIRDLENQLIREHKKGAKEEAAETVVATAEPEKKPAKAVEAATPAKEKPKRAEVPDEPISPVGNSATAKGKDLNAQMQAASEVKDGKEFRRLLALQHEESQKTVRA